MVESEGPHPPHPHYLLAFGLLCFALLCFALLGDGIVSTSHVASLHFRVVEEVRSSKTRHDTATPGFCFLFLFPLAQGR